MPQPRRPDPPGDAIPAGPAALPVQLQATPVVTPGGGHVRAVRLDADLTGHRPGTLHAGVAAGIALAAARAEDPYHLPVTSLDGTVAPVPQTELTTHARPVPSARHDVALLTGDHERARFEIELAGHVPSLEVADLRELAGGRLPDVVDERPSLICAVCGPGGPLLRTASRTPDVVTGVLSPGDEACDADDRVHPTVLLAVMTCVASWMAGEEPSGLHLRVAAVPHGYQPLTVVGHRDRAGGIRVALADLDGDVHAVLAPSWDPTEEPTGP
jgi:hypothetical protein